MSNFAGRSLRIGLALVAAAIGLQLAHFQCLDVRVVAAAARKPPRTVPAPKFNQRERDLFFDDVRKHLGPGELPKRSESSSSESSADAQSPSRNDAAGSGETGSTPSSAAGGDVAGFSARLTTLISPETLEDEIKSQALVLAECVKSPGSFKSGGFKQARESLSLLAVMFAVAGQYEGQVRWQRQAEALRDALARAGFNCKVASDQAYKEAKARSDDLAQVLRGETVDVPKSDAIEDWNRTSDRGPLMMRMELAQRERLAPWTASADELKRHQAEAVHEAELLAVLAELIKQPGYEYTEEDSYQRYAEQLQGPAIELRDAVKQGQVEAASQATRAINKACDACHGDFRS